MCRLRRLARTRPLGGAVRPPFRTPPPDRILGAAAPPCPAPRPGEPHAALRRPRTRPPEPTLGLYARIRPHPAQLAADGAARRRANHRSRRHAGPPPVVPRLRGPGELRAGGRDALGRR